MQYRWKSRSSEVKKFIIAFVNTLTKNYSRILRPLAWIFPEVSQFFYFLGNTSAITWCTPASPWSLARRRLSFSPPGRGPSRTRLCQETVVVTALYSKLFIESLSHWVNQKASETAKYWNHLLTLSDSENETWQFSEKNPLPLFFLSSKTMARITFIQIACVAGGYFWCVFSFEFRKVRDAKVKSVVTIKPYTFWSTFWIMFLTSDAASD